MQVKELLRGGQFLVKESHCNDIFTPEDFSDEQLMMKEAVKEFNEREVVANRDRFETINLPKKLCVKLEKWVFLVFLFLKSMVA